MPQTRVEITSDTSKYERGMRDMKRINQKASNDMKKMWRSVGAVVAGVFAASRFKSIATEWAKAAGVQQEAVAGFHQSLISMGRYTPAFEQQMLNVASSIQKVTTVGDEATIEGLKFLSTYKDIGNEVMPKAAEIMADLSVLMGGNMRTAANLLGKASMGLSGELRRVGITIDENIAKGGDFTAILKEIEKQVGGQARAMAQTGIGPWKQLNNLLGDVKESMGEFVLAGTKHLLPFLTDWAEGVKVIANWMTKIIEGPTAMDVLNKQANALRSSLSKLRDIADDPAFEGYAEDLQKKIVLKEKQLAIVEETIRRETKNLQEAKTKVSKATGGLIPGVDGAGDVTTEKKVEQLKTYNDYAFKVSLEHEERMLSNKQEFVAKWHEWQAEKIIAMKDWEHQVGYDHETKMLALKEGALTSEMNIQYQATQEYIKLEQLKVKAKRDSLNRTLDYMSAFFNQAGKQSEVAFRVYQGIEIGKAIMSAASGAARALAEVPWPMNWVEAAARIAYGAAQVSTIASQSPGGGGSMPSAGVGGGAVPVTQAAPLTGIPLSLSGEQEEKKGALHIHIEGDFIGDEAYIDSLVEKINAAEDRDVFINKSVYAREVE